MAGLAGHDYIRRKKGGRIPDDAVARTALHEVAHLIRGHQNLVIGEDAVKDLDNGGHCSLETACILNSSAGKDAADVEQKILARPIAPKCAPVSRRGNSRRQRPNGLNRGLLLLFIHVERSVALFWTAGDLENKLRLFQDYFNRQRVHSGLGRATASPEAPRTPLNFSSYRYSSTVRPLPDADCRVISGIRQGQAANTDVNSLGWMSGGRYGQPAEKACERAAFGGRGKLWAQNFDSEMS
jgi:hypothetical protein